MIQTTQIDKLSARLAACREVATAVEMCASKAIGIDRAELTALAHRLRRCGSATNQFIAQDAVNKSTGELYNAAGIYWRCNSKMCPNCLAIFAAKNRRKLSDSISRQTLQKGERWYFPTFTIKNPNVTLVQTRAIVNRAWELFRKRLLCVSLIRGGVKSEEFTLTPNGYHYHLHLLFIAQYLEYDEVRRVWTECVQIAFDEMGLPLVIDTVDGYLWVKFQPITNLERLPFEVCKYITKSDSWWKMRNDDLTEVCLVRRWWRMFELFGCLAARNVCKWPKQTQHKAHRSIVHTSDLSDGVSASISEAWREHFDKMSLAEYIELLDEQFWSTIHFRRKQLKQRWPYATLIEGETLGLEPSE